MLQLFLLVVLPHAPTPISSSHLFLAMNFFFFFSLSELDPRVPAVNKCSSARVLETMGAFRVQLSVMTSEVVEDELKFYSKAEEYWKEVPPTVDGMLGGYGHISSIDINGSKKFLQRFIGDGPNKVGTVCALDCGAGIGRITKRLLLPLFQKVDMVDVTEDFLTKAKSYLGEEVKRVENFFCCGLQDFMPQSGRYDVIWVQWVIGHLTDDHLVEFLKRCKKGLRPNGIICIKDNMAHEGVIMDEEDSSVCRDLAVVRHIIKRAGLCVFAEERQENFPEEIYQVYSFAMR
ncbi:N-terminal Xaa-Pro-Lys N-methyltransferase 1 isoform X1 [Latimeria chalumnae]|nr:PREDICTED: N-terminal Xaa-Pro-Lys N-methyltransferase 1 isoform X1 [Latimeria chalumnae]|eukprot:XP_005993305.1 PREDICTED: N-terminal Xaa-Pro-Lys N-methyltransferase 1 isoform X1 [Latimeria chalumnae]